MRTKQMYDRCWQYFINIIIGQIKLGFIFHKLCALIAYYIYIHDDNDASVFE